MALLLSSLVPLDTDPNLPEHEAIIAQLREPYAGPNEEPFTISELNTVIKKIKPRRAAVPDEIPPEALRELNYDNRMRLLNVYNICLRRGWFLSSWKLGKLHILRKAGERDWSNPGSYRPISLLSVLGKTFERLVEQRLRGHLEANHLLKTTQYGFTPGKDTNDAIEEVLRFAEHSRERHVFGLFLDIEGAFNNLWWPAILQKCRRLNVSKQIYNVLEDYLCNRSVELEVFGVKITREVDRGCPQGSILGPLLWNLVMDNLLGMPFTEGVRTIAFADDAVVLVEGNSRAQLEMKFRTVSEHLENWTIGSKLSLSRGKTKLLRLKGNLDMRRPPVVRLHGHSVSAVREIRYLGGRSRFSASVHPKLQPRSEKSKGRFCEAWEDGEACVRHQTSIPHGFVQHGRNTNVGICLWTPQP